MRLAVVAEERDLTLVNCSGQITEDRMATGAGRWRHLLGDRSTSRRVLLNLEQTPFIDTRGISWLLESHKEFQDAGGKLVLHSLPPMVQQVLELLNLTKVLHVAADEPSARDLASQEVS